MGFFNSIFERIFLLVLENSFPDLELLSDPQKTQNKVLFGILNREDVFASLPTGHGKLIIF